MLTREKIIGTVAYLGGVPAVPEPFTYALTRAYAFAEESVCAEGQHLHLDRSKISLHDHARNRLVQQFRGDFLLMLDVDMSFEADFIARLISTMERTGAEVLTGIYHYRQPPHWPVLYMFNPTKQRHEVVVEWDRSSEVFRIDSAGAGCLIVRRSVFDRIREELREDPFARTGAAGEDHSFFARLRKLGIPAYCAWQIEAQHLEYVGIGSNDFDPAKNKPDEFHVAPHLGRVA